MCYDFESSLIFELAALAANQLNKEVI